MNMRDVVLGDIADISLGKMLDQRKNKGEYQPYLANVNVRWGGFDLDNLPQMRFLDSEEERYGLKYGDILVCEGGEPGRCAIWKNQIPNMKYQKALHRVRVHEKDVDFRWLFYRFLYAKSRGEFDQYFSGTTTIKHMPGEKIVKIKLALPDIKIQKRIGDILSSYDDLIENNRKQIKLLEEAAQRLYKEWFIDLRFPGYETTPIVDGIPEGWKKTTVEELCILSKKVITPYKILHGTPYIGLEHIPRKDFCLSEWGNSSEVISSKYQFQKNDIIFCQIRPYFHKVGFAIVDGVASTDSFVMKPIEKTWGLFLMTVSSEAFVIFSYQTCKEGAKMPRADWNQMKNYTVLVAAENIQSKFESFILDMAGKIRALALQNKHLIEARDRLLPKIMNGEMEV